MDIIELKRLAADVKNAQQVLSSARIARVNKEAQLWLETDFSAVGAKLAKQKEVWIQDQLAPERRTMHEAEADLGLKVKLYEISFIQYQKE